MEEIAFRMKLKPGHSGAYRQRHEQNCPELTSALKAAAIRHYAFHNGSGSNTLLAVLWRSREHNIMLLPFQPVMWRWWREVASVMETTPDCSPATPSLETLLHLH